MMIARLSWSALFLLWSASTVITTSAFVVQPSTPAGSTATIFSSTASTSRPRSGGGPLFLSDIPRELPPKQKKQQPKFELPPSPEDQLVMSGDVMALFVYSFLDHSLADYYGSALLKDLDFDSLSQQEIIKQVGLENLNLMQLPVWFNHADAGALSANKLMVLIGFQNGVADYSPAISTAGAASVALTTCWLLSGYVNHAFSFKHTVECTPAKALWVTGKTWAFATFLMVLLALGSDYVWGNLDLLHSPMRGGLTKADADYIFDSLTVLVTWRFIVSYMLGYGK